LSQRQGSKAESGQQRARECNDLEFDKAHELRKLSYDITSGSARTAAVLDILIEAAHRGLGVLKTHINRRIPADAETW
jgi:hypothetical protein